MLWHTTLGPQRFAARGQACMPKSGYPTILTAAVNRSQETGGWSS
jgi:hypothetical protein